MQKNKATVKEVIDELMVEHGLEAEDTILWHPYRGETVERKLSDLDKKDLRKTVLSASGHHGGKENNYGKFLLIVQ